MSYTPTIKDKILDEINKSRKSIKTDGYAMSIGELINLYRDGDLKLDPAFQRLFRWNDEQKTKLIESIIIGIPIPQIFVAQKNDGSWHVVDGVQRVSTILQLHGLLKGKNPLTLTNCKYIPSFEGLSWDRVPEQTQRELKRSRIDVQIILTQNSDESQYELFQRLNTGGTELSPQEVRNCLILMVQPAFYNKLDELKGYDNFKDTLTLKEHAFEKEYHMELIIRMFTGLSDGINYSGDHGSISSIVIDDFFDKEAIRIPKERDIIELEDVFKRTFDKLKSCLGRQSFLKYDSYKKDFVGAFNVSVFEMLSVGVAYNIDKIENVGNTELKNKIIELHENHEVSNNLSRGTRAIQRFKALTEFSKKFFQGI